MILKAQNTNTGKNMICSKCRSNTMEIEVVDGTEQEHCWKCGALIVLNVSFKPEACLIKKNCASIKQVLIDNKNYFKTGMLYTVRNIANICQCSLPGMGIFILKSGIKRHKKMRGTGKYNGRMAYQMTGEALIELINKLEKGKK